MIVQFSVNPMDSEHISDDISRITAYLDTTGLDYTVGPIGTSIQGEWDEVIPVIKRCHEMITDEHARVLTTITIDDHKGKEHSLESSVEAVLEPAGISL